jgi:hypothetical protein
LLGSLQLSIRPIQFRVALCDHRGGGFPLGFALSDEAFGGIDADDRPAQLRFGLTELGMQLRRVHARQHLSYCDEIALPDQDLLNVYGGLGGSIDFDVLDTAVTAGEPGRKIVAPELLLGKVAARAEDHDKEGDQPAFSIAFHGLNRFIDRRRQPIG